MFIIAEVAQAHDGDFGRAQSYIEALSETGVHAIKFQVHIAEAESSLHEPFRVKNLKDPTRYDYWKRMEFSLEQWQILRRKCIEKGVEFLASPFSNLAVDLLEKVGVTRYKVGSGEVNNLLLLEKISRTGKPIILSSGMSSFEELDKVVEFLEARSVEYSILQCTTAYPTPPKNYGLNVIGQLQERYKVPVGYSDHSANIGTCIAATALGAEILEFHAVFDRNSDGPDASSSLELAEIKQLVRSVRDIEISLQNPVDKSNNHSFKELKDIFEKSLSVNKDLSAGHLLTFEDLEAKKPKGYGIDAIHFQKVIGTRLRKDLGKWAFLSWSDIDF